jgi:hypothetical protein
MGYIWKNPQESNATTVLKLINQRCDDIPQRITFANIREKRSSIFYWKMKLGWRGKNIVCTKKRERDG